MQVFVARHITLKNNKNFEYNKNEYYYQSDFTKTHIYPHIKLSKKTIRNLPWAPLDMFKDVLIKPF